MPGDGCHWGSPLGPATTCLGVDAPGPGALLKAWQTCQATWGIP